MNDLEAYHFSKLLCAARRRPPLAFYFGIPAHELLGKVTLPGLLVIFCITLPHRQVPWSRSWTRMNIPGALAPRGRQHIPRG